MNTILRNTLAVAAAGALVLGSAGAATAKPDKASKAKGPKSVVQLQRVSIHGHAPVNFYDVSATPTNSVRDVRLRATVADRKGAVDGAASSVTVSVGLFSKKVNGAAVSVEGLSFDDVTLALAKEKKRSKRYAGTLALTADQQGLIKSHLATATGKTYLCIAGADLVGTEDETLSKQVRKRLGDGRKPVRDCVKLVDVDPSTTKTTTDDPSDS